MRSTAARDDLIVLGGGPCAYNPEPYAPFFDTFLVGEGEEAVPEFLRSFAPEGRARRYPARHSARFGRRSGTRSQSVSLVR